MFTKPDSCLPSLTHVYPSLTNVTLRSLVMLLYSTVVRYLLFTSYLNQSVSSSGAAEIVTGRDLPLLA